MPSIPFTQYVRPDGRYASRETIDRPQDVYDKAMKLIEAGYRFEAEILTTDEVSLTCVDPEDTGDIAIVLSPNNEAICENVDKLVAQAWDYAGKVRIRIQV